MLFVNWFIQLYKSSHLLHCMNLWIWLFLTILHKCYSTTTILYKKKSHIPKKLHLQKKRRNLVSSTYTLQHIKMKDLTFANLHGRNSRNPCLSNTFALIICASLKIFSILFLFMTQIHMFQNKFSRKKGLKSNFISTAFPGHLCCKLTLIYLTFIHVSSSIYHTLYLHMLKTAENLKLKIYQYTHYNCWVV